MADAVTVDGLVVVCSDLHVACGPYRSERAAEKAAIQLTMLSIKKGSACRYKVVPFMSEADMPTAEPKEDKRPPWHGGYL